MLKCNMTEWEKKLTTRAHKCIHKNSPEKGGYIQN